MTFTEIIPGMLPSATECALDLTSALLSARASSPYWSSRFQFFDPNLVDARVLARIPPLERGELAVIPASDLSSCLDSEVYTEFATSGTMGPPLRIRYSKQLMEVLVGILSRFYRLVGLHGRSCVALGYRAPDGAAFAMHALALQRNDIPFFHLDPTDPVTAHAVLAERRSTALFSHASLALQVANIAFTRARSSLSHLEVLLCSGIPLSDSGRDFIDRVLRATTFRCAGATEISLLGLECDRRVGMHVTNEIVFAELPDKIQSTTCGAELVVSTLRNEACHLFRYRLGDFAMEQDGLCPCGSPRPTIRLMGRIGDKAELPARPGGILRAASLQAIVDKVKGLTGGFKCFLRPSRTELQVDLRVEAWRTESDALDGISSFLRRELTCELTESADTSMSQQQPSVSIRFLAPGELGRGGVKYRRVLLTSSVPEE